MACESAIYCQMTNHIGCNDSHSNHKSGLEYSIYLYSHRKNAMYEKFQKHCTLMALKHFIKN